MCFQHMLNRSEFGSVCTQAAKLEVAGTIAYVNIFQYPKNFNQIICVYIYIFLAYPHSKNVHTCD